MMRLWPSRKQWRGWSLPSRLTAVGTYVGIAAILFAVVEAATGGWPFSLGRQPAVRQAATPPIVLELRNSGSSPVTILGRGDAVFWLPEGLGAGPRQIAGKYQLVLLDAADPEPSQLTIPAASEVILYARLEDSEHTAAILDAGTTDLQFVLRRSDASMFFSQQIPFTRTKIETFRWSIEVALP
jgi:hypothetical protein